MFGRGPARLVAVLAFSVSAFGAGKKDRGKELVEGICTLCHGLDRVTSQELSKEEWQGVIKGMLDQGAPVTGEEFSMIVEYLAKNYGPKAPAAKAPRAKQ